MESKNIKGAFFNRNNSDKYNDINEDIDNVEIIRGSILSNEEIEGLSKVDDACEGSEVSITKNINDGTSLDACIGHPTL